MSPLLLLLALGATAAPAQTLERAALDAGRRFDGNAPRPAPVSRAAAASGPMSLAELARALSEDPTAADDLLDLLVAKAGPLGQALDTPVNRARFKDAIRRADPAVLDSFPTATPAEALAAAKALAAKKGPAPEPALPADLPLALTGSPVDPPKDAFLKPLGHGLLYGDETLYGAGAAWGDSKAVAAALNQLASNDPAAPARTMTDRRRRFTGVEQWLTALLAEGHTLEVRDRRMYANFGDLHYEGTGARRDVTTPTLIDTGIVLPSGRRLIIPITHSELGISLRGPRVNAELSFFFGVDGAADFRAQDTADQSWVGGRTAELWTGATAAGLLERAAWVRRGLAAKAKAAGLPMGGYGPLGDCNDANALATGIPPFGMLREARHYAGSGDLDAASRALPFDLTDAPSLTRVWESRPFERAEDIPMPAVREAMLEVQAVLGR